jgi:DNA-binding NarL/FixJ family response regulator
MPECLRFFGPDGRKGKAHKMLPERRIHIQKLIDNGISVYSIAKKEKISEGTIRYWIKKGELKKNDKHK